MLTRSRLLRRSPNLPRRNPHSCPPPGLRQRRTEPCPRPPRPTPGTARHGLGVVVIRGDGDDISRVHLDHYHAAVWEVVPGCEVETMRTGIVATVVDLVAGHGDHGTDVVTDDLPVRPLVKRGVVAFDLLEGQEAAVVGDRHLACWSHRKSSSTALFEGLSIKLSRNLAHPSIGRPALTISSILSVRWLWTGRPS